MNYIKYDVVCDIETNGLRRIGQVIHCIEAIVLPLGGEAFTAHGADQSGYTSLADMLTLLQNAQRIIGHNVKQFDAPCLTRVLGAQIDPGRVVDTLIASRVLMPELREQDEADDLPTKLWGSHGLDAWGHRLSRKHDFAIRKDNFEHRQDQPWSKTLQEHCELDVVVSYALYLHLVEAGL